MAILVRAPSRCAPLKTASSPFGMPYRVIGGPRFYERSGDQVTPSPIWEVVQNPAADLKFERIVNVPKRGLGDSSVQTIFQHARAEKVKSLFQCRAPDRRNRGTEARAEKKRCASLRRFRRAGVRSSLPWRTPIYAELILDDSGYTAMWQKDSLAASADALLKTSKS